MFWREEFDLLKAMKLKLNAHLINTNVNWSLLYNMGYFNVSFYFNNVDIYLM